MNNKTGSKKWELEERAAQLGENIIRFCKENSKNPMTIPLIT